jgi:hypothetical protein
LETHQDSAFGPADAYQDAGTARRAVEGDMVVIDWRAHPATAIDIALGFVADLIQRPLARELARSSGMDLFGQHNETRVQVFLHGSPALGDARNT